MGQRVGVDKVRGRNEEERQGRMLREKEKGGGGGGRETARKTIDRRGINERQYY